MRPVGKPFIVTRDSPGARTPTGCYKSYPLLWIPTAIWPGYPGAVAPPPRPAQERPLPPWTRERAGAARPGAMGAVERCLYVNTTAMLLVPSPHSPLSWYTSLGTRRGRQLRRCYRTRSNLGRAAGSVVLLLHLLRPSPARVVDSRVLFVVVSCDPLLLLGLGPGDVLVDSAVCADLVRYETARG